MNYWKALHIFEESRNQQHLAQIRALLGQAMVSVGEYVEAEPYLMQALEGARAEQDAYVLGIALTNLAVLNNARGDPDEALRLAAEAFQMIDKSGNSRAEGLWWLLSLSALKIAFSRADTRLPRLERKLHTG